MQADSFDLIIIGSGSGNSIPPYLDDRRIAIVERGTFGGTCLNVGCIPSKMFVLPADVAESARHGARLGINATVESVDWPAIRDRVFGRIDPIAQGGREYRATGTPNVELITGTARFVGTHEFDVDGRRITAPAILLAAGARPTIPDIKGLADVPYHTSDTAMRLDELPPRLGIIGGGYIAVELGHVFSAYGSAVTLFNRSGRLVRSEDTEISDRFTEVFGRRVDLRLGQLPERIEQRGDEFVLTLSSPSDGGNDKGEEQEVVVDQILVATGRQPNTDLLDVDVAGLPTTEDGRLVADETMATPLPGIWAIGDVTNPFQLKHLANAEAKVAFWNIAHPDRQRTVDYRAVPHAIFSDPQIAGVGLTEREAEAAGIDVVVGRRDYGGTAFGWALDDTDSFAKVLIDRNNRAIVGAHIIGPQAASIIQPLIQAMQFNQTADEVANDVFYIHPALTEVVENALLAGLEQLA
jgi:mycothione reductase